MAAKTTKENQHFLDEMDNKGMGLLAAKIVDMEENLVDNTRQSNEMMTKLSSIEEYIGGIDDNKKAIQENKDAITEMKIKNMRVVALIAAGASVVGSFLDNGIEWVKGLLAP